MHIYSQVLNNNKTLCSHAPHYWYLTSICVISNQNISSILIIFFKLSPKIWAELMAHPLGPYLPKTRSDLIAWTEVPSTLGHYTSPQARAELG